MSVTGVLDEVAEVGRSSAAGGYRRFASTRDDAALREWFATQARAIGLDVTEDRVSN